MVLLTGMICILAIPPSGMFISEFMIFKAMVSNGQWFVLALPVILLCFVIYAMSTRIMHVSFSSPRNETVKLPGQRQSCRDGQPVYPAGLVIMVCFWQPPFLVDLINSSISIATQVEIMKESNIYTEVRNGSHPLAFLRYPCLTTTGFMRRSAPCSEMSVSLPELFLLQAGEGFKFICCIADDGSGTIRILSHMSR
jgi:NADH:ubiquinone oxidoreductase subunit 5 (subunit L)/multisubunit Na+/H+ antiporter MnhA subunit